MKRQTPKFTGNTNPSEKPKCAQGTNTRNSSTVEGFLIGALINLRPYTSNCANWRYTVFSVSAATFTIMIDWDYRDNNWQQIWSVNRGGRITGIREEKVEGGRI